MWQSDDLTVEHGEPLQVLVGLQLLGGTQRHAQSHGFDFPLNNVDVAGIQEEDKPAGDRKHRKSLKVTGQTGRQLNSSAVRRWLTVGPGRWLIHPPSGHSFKLRAISCHSQSFEFILQTTFLRLKRIKSLNQSLHVETNLITLSLLKIKAGIQIITSTNK